MIVGVLFNLTQAVTVRMGHLFGAGEKKECLYVIYLGVIFAALPVLVIALINGINPLLLISIDFDVHDSKNILLIADAKTYLRLAMLFLFFQAVFFMELISYCLLFFKILLCNGIMIRYSN